MDLKLAMITTAMVVASIWWIVGGFRSTVSSERLPATALRLLLLTLLSWTALGSAVTDSVRLVLSAVFVVVLLLHTWHEQELRILRVWPL